MKRTPFYRRPGRTGKFSGLRERVIWMIQTRGRPVTGSEIAEKFGVTLIGSTATPYQLSVVKNATNQFPSRGALPFPAARPARSANPSSS